MRLFNFEIKPLGKVRALLYINILHFHGGISVQDYENPRHEARFALFSSENVTICQLHT